MQLRSRSKCDLDLDLNVSFTSCVTVNKLFKIWFSHLMGKIKDDDSLTCYDIYEYEYSAIINNICRILGLH